jgi:hypothetical protein
MGPVSLVLCHDMSNHVDRQQYKQLTHILCRATRSKTPADDEEAHKANHEYQAEHTADNGSKRVRALFGRDSNCAAGGGERRDIRTDNLCCGDSERMTVVEINGCRHDLSDGGTAGRDQLG